MKRTVEPRPGARYDLIVVGGGIYGACAAWDAALRGLSVCLLERGDFGSATSANSLRIAHGGLRYLQHGDLRRMRQSVRERGLLLSLAPHLVRPLAFAVPTYGHGLRGRAGHAIGLALADLLGGCSKGSRGAGRFPRSRTVSRAEMLRLCPGVSAERLTGGALWHDGQVRNTERLLLCFLHSASQAGARLANYVQVTGLLREGRRVTGVVARDALDGRELEIPARMVLNAAGPWVDVTLAGVRGAQRPALFPPSKAFNLLTRRIPGERAVGVPGPARFRDRDAWLNRGSRLFFVVPWRGYSLIGTRHLPYRDEPDAFRVTPQDVRLFLEEINASYPAAGLEPEDVLAVYGGLLPRAAGSPAAGEVQLQKHSRVVDHEASDGVAGLLTIVGTKWTTARGTSERAVDLVLDKLGRMPNGRSTASAALATPSAGDAGCTLPRPDGGVPPASVLHLVRTYGSGAREVLRYASQDPELALPVYGGSPVIRAEVVHAVRDEMACCLTDVLLRRTEIALGGHPGGAALGVCAGLMARELRWDEERIDRELEVAERALRPPLSEAAGPVAAMST